MGVQRRRRLRHQGGRTRHARHRRHHLPEGQRRRRVLRHLRQRERAEEPDQALQQLRALPHQDGGREAPRGPCARRRRRRPPARVRDLHRARHHQLDDPHLEAQEERGHARGVQRVLQDRLPRLRGPGAHHQPPRRRNAHLRRPHVRAGPRPLRHVVEGLQEGPGALQLGRADHGQVRRARSRLLQLHAWRGRLRRPHAEHLARDAAAQQPAARHRPPPREED